MGGFFMGFWFTRTSAQAHKRRPERTLTRLKREGVPASKRKPIKKWNFLPKKGWKRPEHEGNSPINGGKFPLNPEKFPLNLRNSPV